MLTTTTAGDTAAKMKPRDRPRGKGMPKMPMATKQVAKASVTPGMAVRRAAMAPTSKKALISSSRPERVRIKDKPMLRITVDQVAGRPWTGSPGRFRNRMPANNIPKSGGSLTILITTAPMWAEIQIKNVAHIGPWGRVASSKIKYKLANRMPTIIRNPTYKTTVGGSCITFCCDGDTNATFVCRAHDETLLLISWTMDNLACLPIVMVSWLGAFAIFGTTLSRMLGGPRP
mmetsp:Transcript_147219/g.257166  ORF Transcript_147219/g.257166 Transcript_147219/m.257166 type:complete len:231 (+) Transcript_147219:1686-2378(+)